MREQDTEVASVARLFRNLGADAAQSQVMAQQLLKRAEQLAEQRDISVLEATETL